MRSQRRAKAGSRCTAREGGSGARRWLLSFCALALSVGPSTVDAAAQEVLSQEEALALAFPGATAIERRTAYLGEQELADAQALAGRGVEVGQSVVSYYIGRRGGQALGVAYFDAHRVRTMQEVVMIVVSRDGTVQRVEILKFSEPPEYRAPERWLEQFHGKPLSADLSLKRGIPNLTGASLTADAVTGAIRRVLAIHGVVQPFETHSAGKP